MKNKIIFILSALMAIVVLSVGMTYSMLMSRSQSIVNTFVAGDIKLTLTESTGSNYMLIPGAVIKKDPRITVGAGSEECWVFFKLTSDSILDSLVDYTVAAGWTPLEGESGVYWRRVAETAIDRSFVLIDSNVLTVKSNATEEQLASVGNPKLTFYGYAIQCEGISTPLNAWEKISSKGDD